MTHEVIVARYREDLDWVVNVPDDFDVVIYNKGGPVASKQAIARATRIIDLPNAGRESDTFLRHIAGKRDASDGFSVFLQGDPFEHSPDIIRLLGVWRHWRDVQPLSWRWLANEKRPPRSLLERETGTFIDGARVRPETFSLTTWSPLQFFDAGSRWLDDEYRRVHDLPDGINIAAHFLRRCEWHDLADQAEQHNSGRFSYGALFATRQGRLPAIPRRSLDLALEAANSHATYGYVLERLWLHMCGEPFLQPALDAVPFVDPSASRMPRFVPSAQASKPALTRRVLPAFKKRMLGWALT